MAKIRRYVTVFLERHNADGQLLWIQFTTIILALGASYLFPIFFTTEEYMLCLIVIYALLAHYNTPLIFSSMRQSGGYYIRESKTFMKYVLFRMLAYNKWLISFVVLSGITLVTNMTDVLRLFIYMNLALASIIGVLLHLTTQLHYKIGLMGVLYGLMVLAVTHQSGLYAIGLFAYSIGVCLSLIYYRTFFYYSVPKERIKQYTWGEKQ